MEFLIRKAYENEHRAICHLLASHSLPTADIHEKNITFFAGLMKDTIVATIGIEQYGKEALLRSLCVKKVLQNKSLGQKMIEHLLHVCHQEGITSLYLLTTTAKSYFEHFGFQTIAREEAPKCIAQTREFEGICPATATLMRLYIQ